MKNTARIALIAAGLTLGLVLPLSGCNLGKQEARVECKSQPAQKAFVCVVRHTKGNKKLNVCWDVIVDCEGDNHTQAHACQQVDPKGTATRKIAYTEFKGTCKKPTGLSVKNLKLTVQ